jgi:hypothetical protein
MRKSCIIPRAELVGCGFGRCICASFRPDVPRWSGRTIVPGRPFAGCGLEPRALRDRACRRR